MHLNEDDLILHYYGEADASENRVQMHLEACGECRGAFEALRRVMEAIDTAPVPEPGPSFERTVWARLEPQLSNRENSTGKNFGWFNLRGLVFAGGLAAMILAVIVWQFDINFTRTADTPAATQAADADTHRKRVLLTAVSDHIEQSELVLVELANATAPNASGALDVSLERNTADDLVSAGRLYRETARQTGDLQLASLLDELEMVLMEIARGPEALSAQQLEDLRTQIDDQELIFKLRVLAAEVKARQQNARPQQGSPKRTL